MDLACSALCCRMDFSFGAGTMLLTSLPCTAPALSYPNDACPRPSVDSNGSSSSRSYPPQSSECDPLVMQETKRCGLRCALHRKLPYSESKLGMPAMLRCGLLACHPTPLHSPASRQPPVVTDQLVLSAQMWSLGSPLCLPQTPLPPKPSPMTRLQSACCLSVFQRPQLLQRLQPAILLLH